VPIPFASGDDVVDQRQPRSRGSVNQLSGVQSSMDGR
jgi:hypothetical protein